MKEKDKHTILITAYAKEEKDVLDRLRTLQITGILCKPFDPKELLQAVKDFTKT
ncbi:MAG: hypothetical protein ACUZ8I_14665 [Candidatus Scalindua sp.]